MKKAFFIVLACSGWAMAGGPKYTYPTVRGLDDEMNNIYHDLKYPYPVYASISSETVNTSSITNFSLGGNMNANNFKITNLANGSASSDATAYGQLAIFQIVQASTTNQQTTTSSTFQSVVGMAVSIQPVSASHRIKVTVSANLRTSVVVATALGSIKRGNTELSGGVNGFCQIQTPATGTNTGQCSFSYIDSPATTSNTTYQFLFASQDNTDTVEFNRNNNNVCTIIVEEIL